MIKVLVLNLSNIYGGIEIYMKNVMDNIDLNKIHIDFLNISGYKMAFSDEFEKKGSKIFNVTRKKAKFC
jgi:hypothetical protein